jgi:hypothetical protein
MSRGATVDGLRATFAAGTEAELKELVAVENECCAWALWTVEGTALTVSSFGEGIAAARQLFAPR